MRPKTTRLLAAIVVGLVLGACGSADNTSVPDENPELTAGTLAPGEYTTHHLGTLLSLSVTEEWDVPSAESGVVILESQDRARPFTRAILILRGISLSWDTDGADASPTDIDAWLGQHDEATLIERGEVTVGGAESLVLDLTTSVDELELLHAPPLGGIVLRSDEIARVWFVDQGEFAPIVIFAPVADDDTGWLEVADQVIETIRLEAPSPSPVDPIDPGA